MSIVMETSLWFSWMCSCSHMALNWIQQASRVWFHGEFSACAASVGAEGSPGRPLHEAWCGKRSDELVKYLASAYTLWMIRNDTLWQWLFWAHFSLVPATTKFMHCTPGECVWSLQLFFLFKEVAILSLHGVVTIMMMIMIVGHEAGCWWHSYEC